MGQAEEHGRESTTDGISIQKYVYSKLVHSSRSLVETSVDSIASAVQDLASSTKVRLAAIGSILALACIFHGLAMIAWILPGPLGRKPLPKMLVFPRLELTIIQAVAVPLATCWGELATFSTWQHVALGLVVGAICLGMVVGWVVGVWVTAGRGKG